MFLFTTPASRETARETAPASPVTQAIRDGADRTGTGFDFLLKTAQRESALDPLAKARTSSATGLFQFIEQTWLGLVKDEGTRHGLSAYASAIQEGDGGRLSVADPQMRQTILELRRDPRLSAVMAGALTQKNRESLGGTLGRAPNASELYMAHVLGARGAGELIRSAAASPNAAAATNFPEAAAANRGIFFDKAGKARSFSEVYALLGAAHAGLATVASAKAQPAGDAAAAPLAGLAPGRARGLVGLFSTEGPRGPVSDAVARIWASPRGGTRVAALDEGRKFFPRTGLATATEAAEPALPPAAAPTVIVDAPLPPRRPAPDAAPAADGGAGVQTRARRPLDLSRFMNWRTRS